MSLMDSIVFFSVYVPLHIAWDIFFVIKMDMRGHSCTNEFVEISTAREQRIGGALANKDVSKFTFFGVSTYCLSPLPLHTFEHLMHYIIIHISCHHHVLLC